MVVKLDADILYWYELDKGWTTSENMASKYPTRREAESRALLIVAGKPDLIGKLHVRDFYKNGFAGMEQGDLFE
jgi:hypothetical protein